MCTARSRARAVFLYLAAGISGYAVAQNAALTPLNPAEIRSLESALDKTLLPKGATDVRIDKQAFHVQSASHIELTLIPINFIIAEPGLVEGIDRTSDECGLYLIEPSGKTRLEMVSENNGPVQCTGVKGIGLAHGQGPHAQIILLFNAHTVRRSWSAPYLISWSENDRRYVMETLAPPDRATETGNLTIAQVRKWVKSR